MGTPFKSGEDLREIMIGSLTDGLLYWITPVATTVERLVIDVDREARPSIEQSFSKRGNVYQTNILKK